MNLSRGASALLPLFLALVLAPAAPAARADEPAHADSPRVLESLPVEAQRVLLEADTLEVLLIACEREPEPGEEEFHGYPVVRKRTVQERPDRVRLLSRLYQGIDEGDAAALCFEPHHGVRARKGELQVDLVICFECLQLHAHGEGVPARGAFISTAAAAELERLLGPIQDRVAGRLLEEWCERLAQLAGAGEELAPDDEAGVVALAEAVTWRDVTLAGLAAETLARLGRRAAPAAPTLGRVLLRADAHPRHWLHAARALKAMGPAAAPAVPALVALLERDLTPLLERARRFDALDDDDARDEVEREGPMLEGDEAVALRVTAVDALGAVGPDAARAIPLLERLGAAGGDEGQAAVDALALIRRPRDAR